MSLEAHGGSGCRQPRAARRRRAARGQRRLRCCPRASTACCACASRPPGRAQATRSSSPSRRETPPPPAPPPRPWHSSTIPAARPQAPARPRPRPRLWRWPAEAASGGCQQAPTRIGLARSGCLGPVSPRSCEAWGSSSAFAAAVSETTPYLTRAAVTLVVATLVVVVAAAVARRVAAAWWLSSCPAVSWRESVCWPRCGHCAQPQPLARPTARRPASLSTRSHTHVQGSHVCARGPWRAQMPDGGYVAFDVPPELPAGRRVAIRRREI